MTTRSISTPQRRGAMTVSDWKLADRNIRVRAINVELLGSTNCGSVTDRR